MDKDLAIVMIACISMLVFFVGYQLSTAYFSVATPDENGKTVDDNDWHTSTIVNMDLQGDSIMVRSSNAAIVSGSKVTITRAGIYNISGSLTDGQIIVNTKDEDPVRLVLNGVNIHCSTSAPISIEDAREAVIILEDGTENFVSDAASYIFSDPTQNEPNAAVLQQINPHHPGDRFSKCQR
jgi:hypothetical protein